MLQRLISRVYRTRPIRVRLPDGRDLAGAAPGEPELTVVLRDLRTVARIAANPELALGEAYVDGGLFVEGGDIYAFLDLTAAELAGRPRRGPGAGWQVRRWLEQSNDRLRARSNVHHHYDLTVDFYRLFLDDDLQYSCAFFEHPGQSLEEAQIAKKRRIVRKLLLRPDDRVLDIGCGWGGLGLTIAEAGARVTGVTLSTEQHRIAGERAAARGLADRAEFRLQDYRDLDQRFDRIVSVGMFEHVGVPNYQAYFDAVARLLEEDGVALIHSIGRKDGPSRTQPWIRKYVFPGGYIPALSEVLPAIERAGLWVTDVEILRLHYAETLRAWRERFLARRAEAAALYDERFCRLWEFYLASSEVAFRRFGHMVFQLQLARRQTAVPLTRDYLCS
ncbi:SAM-dependent methyltransferase [Brevundimonas viscosa]|uniref:Cyclopropane-fatty-acyl-phospholipid synthase n=1 Tax=Brevundimonas viscosa TaxID=871741 RepID=A0A1I6SH75_9CAUL|nr:cyclopropane-fatty-acyl-phospholipid synthase family protein [Brevundimonas viscosa]SFS76220.1 cyclopropane-fatty-acyl-phospholipid synthase [Brevundimonas viscosa]